VPPESPSLDEAGERILAECAVIYLDILGVRSLSTGQGAQKELRDFDRALQDAFPFDLGVGGGELGGGSGLPAAVFSDSFVAVAPVQSGLRHPQADAIAHLVFEATRIQASLLLAGYFLRGAITLGPCHFHEGILFGPALVEAVNLEQAAAVDPRIVLSPDAIETLRDGRGPDVGSEPVLIDEDGLAFVSYLHAIYEDPKAAKPASLAKHAKVVIKKLGANRADLPRWRKYRWAAEYHDHFVSTRRAEIERSKLVPEDLLIDLVGAGREFRELTPRR
jgi:hypothetical protein